MVPAWPWPSSLLVSAVGDVVAGCEAANSLEPRTVSPGFAFTLGSSASVRPGMSGVEGVHHKSPYARGFCSTLRGFVQRALVASRIRLPQGTLRTALQGPRHCPGPAFGSAWPPLSCRRPMGERAGAWRQQGPFLGRTLCHGVSTLPSRGRGPVAQLPLCL